MAESAEGELSSVPKASSPVALAKAVTLISGALRRADALKARLETSPEIGPAGNLPAKVGEETEWWAEALAESRDEIAWMGSRILYLEARLEEADTASFVLSQGLEEMGQQIGKMEDFLIARGGRQSSSASQDVDELIEHLQGLTRDTEAWISSRPAPGGSEATEAEAENVVLRKLLEEAGAQLRRNVEITTSAGSVMTNGALNMSTAEQQAFAHLAMAEAHFGSTRTWMSRKHPHRSSRRQYPGDISIPPARLQTGYHAFVGMGEPANAGEVLDSGIWGSSSSFVGDKEGWGSKLISRRSNAMPHSQFGSDWEGNPDMSRSRDDGVGCRDTAQADVRGQAIRSAAGAVQRALEGMVAWQIAEHRLHQLISEASSAGQMSRSKQYR